MENRNTQGKRYGLQVPKKPVLGTVQPRLSVFADDSDSENEDGSDWVKKTFSKAASKSVQKKQTKLEIQRALKEDPTVYQYDEIYEQLEEKKQEAKSEKIAQEKKPRYIQALMAHAEQRKREQERRTERQVQKEREAEGEAFKDKEAFITASYRKKLEEFRLQDEQERRREELEAIGDVTKQEDLSGFYRHLYHQTVGENKPTIKQEKDSDEEQEPEVEKKQDEPDIKPSTSMKKDDENSNINEKLESEMTEAKEYPKGTNPALPLKKKNNVAEIFEVKVSPVTGLIAIAELRRATNEEVAQKNAERKRAALSEIPRKLLPKKQHSNESNQDADTDLSSSSSESESDTENKSRKKKREAIRARQYRRRRSSSSSEESSSDFENITLATNTDTEDERAPRLKTSFIVEPRMTNGNFTEAQKENETNVRKEYSKTRIPDLSIYEKRTVGAKLEEEKRKYLERKAAREANNIFF